MNMTELWEQLQNFQSAHPGIYSAIVAVGLILAALLANWITKRLLLRGLVRILHALPARDEGEKLARLAIVSRLANIVPALVLAYGSSAIPEVHATIEIVIRNVCIAFIVLSIALGLVKVFDLAGILYNRRPMHRTSRSRDICNWQN